MGPCRVAARPHLIDVPGGLRYAVRMGVLCRNVCRVFCLLLAVSAAGLARAESLRCNGEIVSEGDARLSVLRRCGQPALKDSQCAPVYVAGRLAPCVPVEDWLYERGPGFLTATVRFRAGVVQTILYGQERP